MPSLKKAVIPAAGLGTRLLSATKVQPKEMLPVFASDSGGLCIKPLVQLVFEQLYDFGMREFCFVVGRGKRAIEDHFTPDEEFLEKLDEKGKGNVVSALEEFYRRIEKSSITWVNQPRPLGFGHAVLQAKSFVRGEPFLVHAGDAYVYSEEHGHLKRLWSSFEGASAACALALRWVKDPRQYGVASGRKSGGTLLIREVVEKPQRPRSNLAITPIYVFDGSIFGAVEGAGVGVGGEIQLTDGIQALIKRKRAVVGVEITKGESWIDIGTPPTYWEALQTSYGYSSGSGRKHR